IDVNHSGWKCRWEDRARDAAPAGACRVGMKFVKGLRHAVAARIEAEQARGPFTSADDLVRRCALHRDELAALAHIGALASLGLTRRQALWQVALASRPAGELFEGERNVGSRERARNNDARRSPVRRDERLGPWAASPLVEMTPVEETLADFHGTEMTTGAHPVTYVRETLQKAGVTPAAQLDALPNRATVRIGGSVIVRQRPGTARGLLFVTL